jgi:hypothetical protein
MKEFIDYVKANPGKLNYGSSGVGSTHHLSMEALKSALGLQMTHVPFKGTSESVPALLGGHVDVAFSAYPSLSGAVGTKNITLLATNGAKRSAMAPTCRRSPNSFPGSSSRRPSASTRAPARRRQSLRRSQARWRRSSRSRRSSSSSRPPASSQPAAAEGVRGRAQGRGRTRRKTVKAAGMTPQ